MRITLRHIAGCPHLPVVEARLRETLAELGVSAEIILERVETRADAKRLGFRGSPTVLIEGRDPFPVAEASIGLASALAALPG